VLKLRQPWERLAWLVEHLDDLAGSGIIYCLTVAAAQDTAALLAEAGHQVVAYTGRTDEAERQWAEEALQANRVKALVATSALGMGFDKPDLGFVVHLGAPSSPVAYYQQVGRAGRATDSADVLLMPGPDDPYIWDFFATASMPSQASALEVLAVLERAAGPLSVPALEARVNLRRTRLELLLKVLAVDGAVEAVPGGWARTGQPWAYDAQRYQRVAAARVAEQRAMVEYERGTMCRMAFLTSQLDDPHSSACGRCDVCAPPWYPLDIPADAAQIARGQLDRAGVELAPRARWPAGLDRLGVMADAGPVRGVVDLQERAEPGRVVARLTDLGWGTRLRKLLRADADGNPVDLVVPADVVQACFAVLREWPWAARPTAVVWVPSCTRARLVESLATSIAQAGRLEMLGPLELAQGAGPVRHGTNSAFRVRDVWSRFQVPEGMARRLADWPAPVLLVDEFVDTGWTMTVAARALRRAGAVSVLPFALVAW
jgi:ATP-dependent DNA helicase RecQ